MSDRVGALCIFGGKRGLLVKLLVSHPPMEKCIDRLLLDSQVDQFLEAE